MKSKENPMTNAKQENNSSFVLRHSSLVTPNSSLVIRKAVRRCDAYRKPRGYYPARPARAEGGRSHRLRGHASHGQAALPFRNLETEGKFPRTQRGCQNSEPP